MILVNLTVYLCARGFMSRFYFIRFVCHYLAHTVIGCDCCFAWTTTLFRQVAELRSVGRAALKTIFIFGEVALILVVNAGVLLENAVLLKNGLLKCTSNA